MKTVLLFTEYCMIILETVRRFRNGVSSPNKSFLSGQYETLEPTKKWRGRRLFSGHSVFIKAICTHVMPNLTVMSSTVSQLINRFNSQGRQSFRFGQNQIVAFGYRFPYLSKQSKWTFSWKGYMYLASAYMYLWWLMIIIMCSLIIFNCVVML